MPNKRIAVALLAVILLTGLLTGCSGGKTLTLQINGASWKLIDSKTKAEIAYTTLQYQGQEVIKTSVMSGFQKSLYLAFSEDQLKTEGGTTSYNGGTAITAEVSRKYTLTGGVLNILE